MANEFTNKNKLEQMQQQIDAMQTTINSLTQGKMNALNGQNIFYPAFFTANSGMGVYPNNFSNGTLSTTAKDGVGSINELLDKISNLFKLTSIHVGDTVTNDANITIYFCYSWVTSGIPSPVIIEKGYSPQNSMQKIYSIKDFENDLFLSISNGKIYDNGSGLEDKYSLHILKLEINF